MDKYIICEKIAKILSNSGGKEVDMDGFVLKSKGTGETTQYLIINSNSEVTFDSYSKKMFTIPEHFLKLLDESYDIAISEIAKKDAFQVKCAQINTWIYVVCRNLGKRVTPGYRQKEYYGYSDDRISLKAHNSCSYGDEYNEYHVEINSRGLVYHCDLYNTSILYTYSQPELYHSGKWETYLEGLYNKILDKQKRNEKKLIQEQKKADEQKKTQWESNHSPIDDDDIFS